jgi:hypothetical protein
MWKVMKAVVKSKLEPYLVVIYLLICSSVASGLLVFYRGERSTTGIALQSFIFLSLLPNFVFIVILAPTLVRRDN